MATARTIAREERQFQVLVQTYGFDGLEETFNNFAYKDKKRILLAAFKKAVRPTVEQAKANVAPFRKSGNLYKSIGTLPLRGEIGILVGARKGGTSEGQFAGYHGHLLNNGTVDRFYITKKGVRHETGKMGVTKSYSRWFTKAAISTEDQAVKSISDDWYNEVSKFIVKHDRKDN